MIRVSGCREGAIASMLSKTMSSEPPTSNSSFDRVKYA
jgi:hypothetical protein